MNRAVKRALRVVLAIGAVILLVYVFRPQPLDVELGHAARGPLRVTIDEDGQTRAHDRFTLTAPVAGLLSRIELHEGDDVAADAIVATIEPLPADPREETEIRARIASAQALNREAEQNVGRADAAHQQAERDSVRAEALFKQGILPRDRFEEAQSKAAELAKEAAAARDRAKAAEAEVRRTEAGLLSVGAGGAKRQAVTMRAPAPGRILRIIEKSAGVVQAGAPILVLSNIHRIEIVSDLLSTDAVRVQPGAAVSVENWGGETALRARVRTVEPFGFTKVSALGVEEQRVNVITDFIDPPAGLGDGYRVDVRIVIWESPAVLKIPASALFRVGEAWHVFAVTGGRARLRPVEIGHRNALEAEVQSGLQEGDAVVLHPSGEVRDGAAVKP